MDEYLEGYDDALKSVPIVSAEYAALERERDELKGRVAELVGGLSDLSRAYVRLLDSARERILFLGGDCDPVDVMERGDPYLRQARSLMGG